MRRTLTIARKEIREALRNRWFLLYAAGFAVLALALAMLTTLSGGGYGEAGYGRTAAGLVHLVSLFVPLIGLTLGALSLASETEAGTLRMLLAQPVARWEVVVGKFAGTAVALAAALAAGFGLTALALALRGQGGDGGRFLWLAGATIVLAWGMLALGLCLSSLCQRSLSAAGVAVVVWLALVFLSDLGLMGSSLLLRLQVEPIFAASMFHPVHAFKLATLSALHTRLDVLGPVGLYAMRAWGEGLLGWLFGALLLWLALPLGLAVYFFERQKP